jgi:hypothetical protein
MSRTFRVRPVPARFDRSTPSLAVFAAVIGCLLLIPGAAQADETVGCNESVSQIFAPWGDFDNYRLAPGGDFDGSTEGWQLSDGASVQPGESPLGGSSVLSLPRGSSAVSAPICLDGSEPHARMFVQTTSNFFRAGRVLVEAVSPNGPTVAVGTVRGDDEWSLSRRFAAPAWWVKRDGIDSFQYQFTSFGVRDTVVDGLYVDPRARW